MGFLNTYKDQAKNEIGLKLKYKENIDSIKDANKHINKSNGIKSVSSGVSENEFINRYNGLRTTLFVLIAFFSLFLYKFISAQSLMGTVFSMVVMLMVGLFYYRYSFTAWRARKIYHNWEIRGDDAIFYYSEYNNDIMISKSELFPISLPEKKENMVTEK